MQICYNKINNQTVVIGLALFPSSKPPYRFCKVVSFWIFLLIRLGLGLGLGLGLELGLRLWLGVRVGVGFGLVTYPFNTSSIFRK